MNPIADPAVGWVKPTITRRPWIITPVVTLCA